ncbi:MAG: UDP-N-acetylmuramoyl-tripeptide--D-alanyl-D-alanine ligase [Candidatus Omnitrophica bacterium]|nr:UDP-N-acetylmuramoyl-tripeptide--D-alanyl-D-alanine ligase [Candidatus Omnitrophota bacterium]
MINYTLKDLAEAALGTVISGDTSARIGDLSIDSRTIKKGDVFIALKGDNHDGHDFIGEVLAKGALGVIAETFIGSEANGKAALITVKGSSGAIRRVAEDIRGKLDIPFIGVTGSNGKTTVKELIALIISAKFKTLKSQASYNNVLGVSLTLFNAQSDHEIAVMELGTNHPGEIRDLAGLVRPRLAVITNIGDSHLEFLGDRDGVFREKSDILSGLGEGGAAFFNGDDNYLRRVNRDDVKVLFYGERRECDYRVTDIKCETNGSSFRLNGNAYFIPVPGAHNVHNAAAAVSVASYLGVDPGLIGKQLMSAALPKMRLEKVKAHGIDFINDSYNSNPSSFEAALGVLSSLGEFGKKIVVSGEMMELGKLSEQLHIEIGRKIAGLGIDRLITVGAGASSIASGAIDNGFDPRYIYGASDAEGASRILSEVAAEGDTVLIKGSRKTKMEEILKCFSSSYIR